MESVNYSINGTWTQSIMESHCVKTEVRLWNNDLKLHLGCVILTLVCGCDDE